MQLLIATVVLFLLSMLGLGLGMLLSGRCLQGSCGGRRAFGPDGAPLSCETCPNRRRKQSTPSDRDHGGKG